MYHVLVAEDEWWIRSAVVKMVENIGQEFKVVGEASNGKEAWEIIQELWPSIVITDIMMPEQDGLSLINKIADNNLPIVTIIISGYDNFQYAQKAIKTGGVSEYMLKPVVEEELNTVLQGSIKKLETMKVTSNILIDIQEFINSIQSLHQLSILDRQEKLVDSILTLKTDAKVSFLRILWSKINGQLTTIIPKYEPKDYQHTENHNLVKQNFQSLIEKWIQNYPEFSNNNMKIVIKHVCEYIEHHYMEEITVKEMAIYANLSVSYFSALFKQYTGESFVNYVNLIRIEKAKKLLTELDLKVYEVSEMVGFSSLNYFNRVFKKITSFSPNEYRKSLGV